MTTATQHVALPLRTVADFEDAPDYARVEFVGQLSDIQPHMSRQGQPWATARLVLVGGRVDIQVPPVAYPQHRELLTEGAVVRGVGRVDRRGDTAIVTILEIAPA